METDNDWVLTLPKTFQQKSIPAFRLLGKLTHIAERAVYDEESYILSIDVKTSIGVVQVVIQLVGTTLTIQSIHTIHKGTEDANNLYQQRYKLAGAEAV